MKNKKIVTAIKSFFQIIKFCTSLAWNTSKFYTLCRLLMKFVIPLSGIALSFLAKNITDILAGEKQIEQKSLFLLIVLSLILNIMIALANQLTTYSTKMHNDMLEKDINLMIMDKSLKADMEMFDNPDYYDKFTVAQRDSQSISLIIWNLIDFTSELITVISVSSILSKVNFVYAILLILGTLPAAITTRSYVRDIYEISVSQIDKERKKEYFSYVATEKMYAQSIRLYNLGDYIKSNYMIMWNTMYLVRKKLIRVHTVIISIFQFIPQIIITGITIDVVKKIINGYLSVGDFVLYTGLFTQLWSGIMNAIDNLMEIYDNKMKIENIKVFQEMSQNVLDVGTRVIEAVDTIEFRDVYFSYPGTEKEILKGISFYIRKNEKVALVGLNGTGKSTIIKLLLRFYDVDKGTIFINGYNIKEFTILSLRRCFDCYFQNSPNYGFSLRDNVIIGNDPYNSKENEVVEAIKAAQAIDILYKAPQGLDTYLTRMFSDDGMELSDGQHQKIALARTFYNDRDIILLDEPSSSLDPKAESKLFETIKKLCTQKTVFFTSHRLSNINLADRILVLTNGKIVENGTKEELLKLGACFSELYQYQAEKFN